MNRDRFDNLSKALASETSRRGVLKGLLAAVAGVALGRVATKSAEAEALTTPGVLSAVQLCPTGYTFCAANQVTGVPAHCANLKTDPTNCGTCATICAPGQVCGSINGSALSVCFSPLTLCGNQYTDVRTDPNNCGVCGFVCPQGQKCSSGKCSTTSVCPGTGVLNGTLIPADLSTDPNNCGSCGHVCAPNSVCCPVPGAGKPGVCCGVGQQCVPNSLTGAGTFHCVGGAP